MILNFALGIIIIFGLVVLAVLIKKWLQELADKQKPSEEVVAIIKLLQQGSQEDRKVLLATLEKNTQSLNQRLDQAAQVINNVQRNLGEMSEIGRGLRDMQEFLRSPKLRGNIGEQVLKDLLEQMLPKQKFHLQYVFPSGATVDAAIQTNNGIIPIDAKFPLENFRRIAAADDKVREQSRRAFNNDVRKHIRDIASKYIRTEAGTIDYALMYLPSEAVYYEIVNDAELFDYAGVHRVLPVSPTTFYAYLRAILISLEGQKIEQTARQIIAGLRAIEKDYTTVQANITTLHRHLTNASNMLNTVVSGYTQLGYRIQNTQTLTSKEQLV